MLCARPFARPNQFPIVALFSDKFRVSANLDNGALSQYHNLIGTDYGG